VTLPLRQGVKVTLQHCRVVYNPDPNGASTSRLMLSYSRTVIVTNGDAFPGGYELQLSGSQGVVNILGDAGEPAFTQHNVPVLSADTDNPSGLDALTPGRVPCRGQWTS
jgi:hypothetical protein